MITLKNDFRNFCRKADAQIGLLQDVIGLVKKGKYVNVEAMLGTGDEEKEAEWEQGKVPILTISGHWKAGPCVEFRLSIQYSWQC